jgi:hypothetical protein
MISLGVQPQAGLGQLFKCLAASAEVESERRRSALKTKKRHLDVVTQPLKYHIVSWYQYNITHLS